ncbi:hypothetical protein [Salipiger sp.]|uniref:hypothetical protein n=1 Tax=Salipiger sp. TaxID=2078585 RepID=UPI003A97EEBD
MTMHDLPDDYGTLAEPGTLTIQRFLPGPIERVWDHLTDSELRRKWLAGGRDDARGRLDGDAHLAQ